MKRLMILTLGAIVACAPAASAQATPPAGNPDPPSQTQVGPNFVDDDGDGICDRYQDRGRTRSGKCARCGQGPGDGSGNRGVGPRDGSGHGRGSRDCDGTGPRGRGRCCPRR
jgi:hypothetical protein